MIATQSDPTALTVGPSIQSQLEWLRMQHNNTISEEEAPDFPASYGAYTLLSDAGDQLRDAIAKCDNPITLQEVAHDLQEATERIAQRLSEVQARVDALYFPRLLVEVA